MVAWVAFQIIFIGMVLYAAVQYFYFFSDLFQQDLFLSIFSTVIFTEFTFLFLLWFIHRFTRVLMTEEEGIFPAGSWNFNLWAIGMTAFDSAYFLVNKFFIHQFFPELFYKMFGATIGKGTGVYAKLWDVELLEVGDDSFLGTGCIIGPHAISQGELYRKKVKIGKNCTIGAGTIILPGVTIQDNVIVASNSVIPANRTLKPNSIYAGSPVRKIKDWDGKSVWAKPEEKHKDKKGEE